MNPHPPLPPFTEESAMKKVLAAEAPWNSRDPERVSLAYTKDIEWRNPLNHTTNQPERILL